MSWNLHGTHVQPGDLAQLVGINHKKFLVTLTPGQVLHTHRGWLRHDDLIGQEWGGAVTSHLGTTFYLLQPSLSDVLRSLPRETQIIYPKDIGFILTSLGIGPGIHVAEAGTGSGALTTALAFAVGRQGKVYSYDSRAEFQELAKKNLEHLGLENQVVFRNRDILDGFLEHGLDALFLDLPNPWDYIEQIAGVLKCGGFFGSLLPTTNQVSDFLRALKHGPFAFIDVCEISLRYYRIDPERLRPTDRMVAHTGFLIFARAIRKSEDQETEEYSPNGDDMGSDGDN